MKTNFTYTLLGTAFLILSCNTTNDPNTHPDYHNWNDYLGDSGRSHFSTLTQIDTINVKNLELAWSYKSGGLENGRTTQIQTNPLIIESTLYGVNAAMELFAVNGENGKQIWNFKPATKDKTGLGFCLLYTSPSPRDKRQSRMPSSA